MINNKTSMSNDQHNKKINKPFNIAKAPMKTTMNNPDFLKLTAAEKLNDSEYRRLIYRTYPNEPTCGCTSPNGQQSSNALLTIDKHQENSSDNFLLKCPGGCKSSCCSSLRRSPTANNKKNNNNDKVTKISVVYTCDIVSAINVQTNFTIIFTVLTRELEAAAAAAVVL